MENGTHFFDGSDRNEEDKAFLRGFYQRLADMAPKVHALATKVMRDGEQMGTANAEKDALDAAIMLDYYEKKGVKNLGRVLAAPDISRAYKNRAVEAVGVVNDIADDFGLNFLGSYQNFF